MKTKIIICLLMVVSTLGLSQQSFFLDSLFMYDLSHINEVQLNTQKSEIERLQHDWGLSLGTSITNSYQEEIDAGLSTRVFARANMLSGGFYENAKQSEIIGHQIQIDSIQGVDRAIDNNYGVYYNYIIYLYNQEKLGLIDSIIDESNRLTEHYQNLYYNKLIDYNEILSASNTSAQYIMLQQSQESYNIIFEKMLGNTSLPRINTEVNWNVDFEALFDFMEQDSSSQEALSLQNEILDIQYQKSRTPSLALSAGYDMSRHSPYFGVSFNVDLKTHQKQNTETKKLQIANEYKLAQLQQGKEIINLQYEYRYKAKQIRGLSYKLQALDEEERKYEVRRAVLSLSESIAQQKISLNRKLVYYEMVDLRQQQMLLLLKIKKSLHKIKIGPFIKKQNKGNRPKKYEGNRYLLITEGESIHKLDIHLLIQNEITTLLPNELVQMSDIQLINPDDYDTRAELENDINRMISASGVNNFLIESIESLKRLEIKTLEQRGFDITSVQK